jgi:hypothetical protein
MMKISKSEIQKVAEEPIGLFYQGIRAAATKESYTRTLRRILCEIFEDVLEGTFEERATQMVCAAQKDPEWIMSLLLTLSKRLKERTELAATDPEYLSPNSFPRFFKPVRKLLDMNAVPVAWKRISYTFPSRENTDSQGRGYTREEIQKMLGFVRGPVDKALILVASSSGIRGGGFTLHWEDLAPVYKVDDKIVFDVTESEEGRAQVVCAMLTVYRKTSEEYPAFITPEAYKAIMDYRQKWITEVGKEPLPSDPLFKEAGPFVKELQPEAIRRRMQRVVKFAGIRTPLVRGKRRHEIPIMNGFRRFFNKINKETISKDSPLAALIKKEYMMDHVGLVALDRNYFKTHIGELVEEYLNAVPHLTISDEEREKSLNKKLRIENKELYQKNIEIAQLRENQDKMTRWMMRFKELHPEMFSEAIPAGGAR